MKMRLQCVRSHNTLILACIQLQPKNTKSLIVEQSFGVLIVCICCKLLSYAERKKERNKRRREKEEKNEIESLMINFWPWEGLLDLWKYIVHYIRIGKGFHLEEFCITLLCLSWRCSNTLCTGCHFQPVQSLLRSTSILCDLYARNVFCTVPYSRIWLVWLHTRFCKSCATIETASN